MSTRLQSVGGSNRVVAACWCVSNIVTNIILVRSDDQTIVGVLVDQLVSSIFKSN